MTTVGDSTAPASGAPTSAPVVHRYRTSVRWSGSTGVGYDEYDRGHTATTDPPTVVLDLASDPAFRGDPTLLNPEQLLVASASSCQLLSFLAVAARARLDVVDYADHAEGVMPEGPRRISVTTITLRPAITIAVTGPDAAPSVDRVRRLVHLAHRECYIANSLRTEVVVEPTISFVDAAPTGRGVSAP